MFLKKFLFTVLVGVGLAANAAAATEDVDYKVLSKPLPQTHPEKIEVLEFFGYFCIHCKNLDPVILKYVKTLPSDVYFQADHVVWDESHMGLARLAAAVNQSGLKYSANPAIFKALFDDKVNLLDPAVAVKWMGEQKSFNGKKLLEAYNAFGNQAEAKKMAERTQEYNVTSTPTVIVGGKYVLLFPKGFAAGMQTIDELVDKIREERGLKKPAAKPKAAAPKSKGGGLAASANR